MLERLLVNWPFKLLAVSLAFGIWISITGDVRIVQDFQTPLTVALPEDRMLSTDPPTTVTVRLRGTETTLRRLDALRLAVSVDLRDGIVGERDISLTLDALSGVPRDVDVEFIEPDRLKLTVDRKVLRRLPVEPTFLGRPPAGFTLYSAEVDPKVLLVEGPESEVGSLEVLRTNPIRLDTFTRPIETITDTVPDSPHVSVVDARPVKVMVLVDATPVERKFEEVPIVVVGADHETVLSIKTISVTLSGPPNVLDNIETARLRAVADVTGLEPREPTWPVDLTIRYRGSPVQDNPRITISSMSRSRVRVRITDVRTTRRRTES